jgi:hypothetical protein
MSVRREIRQFFLRAGGGLLRLIGVDEKFETMADSTPDPALPNPKPSRGRTDPAPGAARSSRVSEFRWGPFFRVKKNHPARAPGPPVSACFLMIPNGRLRFQQIPLGSVPGRSRVGGSVRGVWP